MYNSITDPMKTQILQLESHDDIVSARDKMTWVNAGRILLVWPRTSKLFSSPLDLILLQRHARNLGSQICLVTSQGDVKANAVELDIPVFRSIQQARRKAWQNPQTISKAQFQRAFRGDLRQARPKQGPGSRILLNSVVRLLVFLIAIFAVLSLLAFLLPSARIEVSLPTTVQELDLQITARVDSPVTPAGNIPYTIRRITISREGQAPATGSISSPGMAASGIVEFTNLTEHIVNIPAGTVVLTGENIRYQTQESIEVPASAGSKIEAPVLAETGGTSGNAAIGQVNAIEGDLGFQVAVTNPKPLSGGTDTREQSPAEIDITALEKRVLSEMAVEAGSLLEDGLGTGERLIEGSSSIERVITRRISSPAGEASATVSIFLEAEFSAAVYQERDLQSAAEAALNASLPPGKASLPGTMEISIQESNESNLNLADGYTWMVTARRQVTDPLIIDQVTAAAAGRSKQLALASLQEVFPDAENISLQTNPKWWPFMPAISFRIEVLDVNLQATTGEVD